KEGVKFQITTYDKKDKIAAVINYEIVDFDGNKATMSNDIFDNKGKLIITSNYNIYCKDNGVSIDFNSMVSPQIFEQYKDMEIDMTGTNIELPNDLEIGQILADANINMKINMGPVKMNMSVDMINRKVEGSESVTTPAGTFNCIVISN